VRDLSHKVFVYPSTVEPPYNLFPDDWAYELTKVKELVRHTIMREYWKRHRSNKQHYITVPTTVFNNTIPIQPTGWVSCLHTTMTSDAPSSNANRFAPLQAQETTPRNEDVQEELRRLQDQVAQLGRRLHGAPESSSAQFRSGVDRRAPTYRPQHEHLSLAPRRRTRPPMHRGYMAPPPRQNMWARCHDYTAPP